MALGDKVTARILVGGKAEDVTLEATAAGGQVVVSRNGAGEWEVQELGRTGTERRKLVINPSVLLTLLSTPRGR